MSNTTPESIEGAANFQEQPELAPDLQGNENLYPASEQPEESPDEQAKFGEAQAVSVTTNIYQRILALVVNLLLVVQLFVAMYFAAQQPDRFQPEFFSWFFRMLIPTLIGAFIAKRIIKARCK